MKTRILVAAVGIPLLLVIILFAPLWALGLVFAAISGIGAWELLRCTTDDVPRGVYICACAAAAAIEFCSAFPWWTTAIPAILFLLVLSVSAVTVLSFRGGTPLPLAIPAAALAGGGVLPVLLSAVVRLGLADSGIYYLLLVFVVTFSCDSGAYFVGCLLGKNHIAPHVSPNKTMEGCLGGLAAGILMAVVYGAILALCFDMTVRFAPLAAYGCLCSIACELGDLSFSAVKRIVGIKDYSNLIPGHGGALDRFDSMHFTAAMLELLAALVPVIVK